MFPKFLYHADHDAFVRTSQTEYPIRISTQEELDNLEPGWSEDPVEAAAFLTRSSEEADSVAAELAKAAAQIQADTDQKLAEEFARQAAAAVIAAKEDAEFKALEAQVAAEDAARLELNKQVAPSTQDVIARAMAASKANAVTGDSE